MLTSFTEFERIEAVRNTDRALEAVLLTANDQHKRTVEWAQHDEAYNFLIKPNQEFVKRHLNQTLLKDLEQDIALVVKSNGTILTGVVKNRGSEFYPPVASVVLERIGFKNWTKSKALRKKFSARAGFSGFIPYGNKNQGNMMVSVRPILPSQGRAPIRGWIVFARYLDRNFRAQLGKVTQLEISASLYNDRLTQDSEPLPVQEGKKDPGYRFRINGNDFVSFAVINDISGKPFLTINVKQQRHLFAHGMEAFNFLMRSVAIVAIGFAIVFFGLMKTVILARLYRLTDQVERLSPEDQTTIELPGKDEFSVLAAKTNELLQSGFKIRAELKSSQGELQKYTEGLEKIVAERTRELSSMNAVLEIAVEGIGRFNHMANLVEGNLALAQVLRTDLDELIGKSLFELVKESQHEELRQLLRELPGEAKLSIETEREFEDSDTAHQELVLIPLFDDQKLFDGFFCFMKDITQRKELEEKIYYQAFHDNLTGLPNRLQFNDRISQAVSRANKAGTRVGVMFIDLDNFKYVNDSLGHNAGDELLCIVARRLSMSVRPGDIVARMGGDEFTILLEGIKTDDEVIQIAERTVRSMKHPVKIEQRDLFVTFSVGIAITDMETRSANQLLRNADTAMYQAKLRGKAGYTMYDPIMNKQALERLEIETGIRTAITEGHFKTCYQPIYNLYTEQICGAEALVRWEDPDFGTVPPSKFIPIAEETGLIIEIGEWVLRDACKQAQEWIINGAVQSDFVISVNLSTKQIQKADIIDRIAQALEESGLPPNRLKLEVTESAMMDNLETTVQKLETIRALGILVALDDFGTGYSSLSYLSKLPVDNVKIDRSFINVLGIEPQPTAIASAILTLCSAMNKSVTAEGIETREQLKLLRSLGCQYGQGYLFSRPISSEEFEDRFLTKLGTLQDAA